MTSAQSSPTQPRGGASGPLSRPLQVAQVDCDDAARPQRPPDRGQPALDRGDVRQVVEDVPDADDRIGLGERVVGQRQQAEVGAAGGLARQIEHRRRRVSCDDPVPGIERGTS